VMKVTKLIELTTLPEALAPSTGKVEFTPRPVPKPAATYLGERAADAKQVAEARARLMPAAPVRDLRVEKFPPMQVILLDEVNRFEAARDDVLKWLAVPAWQLPAGLDKREVTGVFAQLAPGITKVSIARSRIQQQIGMLQAVEGLRAFAAANSGRLPTSLDELKLPLPPDPFTGRPFRYEVLNGVASVRATPPPGREGDATLNRVYEVRVRK
jgi:hypothetical protein